MARLIIDNYHEFDEEVQFISKKSQIEEKLEEISASVSEGSGASAEAIQGVKDDVETVKGDVADIQTAMEENVSLDELQAKAISANTESIKANAELDESQAKAIEDNASAIAEIQSKGFVTAEEIEGMGFVKSEDIPDAPSLDGYATEEWVEGKNYLTEHQSLEDYAKKDDLPEVPSLDGYATEEWVEGKNYLTEHQSLEGYAKSEDLSDFVTADAVAEMGFLTEHQSLEDYAKKVDLPEVPSLDGYATEEWVENKGFLTEHQSLEDYAKAEDIPNADAIKGMGFLTEDDITPHLTAEAIAEMGFAKSEDITPHLTKEEIEAMGFLTEAITEHQSLEGYAKTSELVAVKKDSDGLAKTIDVLLNKIAELEKQHEDMPTSIVALNESLAGDYVPTNGELYLINSVVEGEKGGSNAKVAIDATDVVIDNVTVTPSDENPIYNVFEQKQVSENVKVFNASNVSVPEMKLAHNVFNLYNLEDDAVITIKDCDLNLDPSKSNAIRLSNYSNASNVVVNLENINWTYENAGLPDDSDDWAWAGLILFQAAGADASLSGDTQYIDTWKFNFKNCKYNGELVTDANFGGNQHNQVIYFYNIGGTKQISLEAVELNFYDADGNEV